MNSDVLTQQIVFQCLRKTIYLYLYKGAYKRFRKMSFHVNLIKNINEPIMFGSKYTNPVNLMSVVKIVMIYKSLTAVNVET